MKAALFFACFALLASASLALNNGLGLTPQMGWNSWNFFACNINETVIRSTADTLISSGLAKVGYDFVNIDDCWADHRDSDGNVVADAKTFPSGIKALADYVHSLGLKFGIYSDAGNLTCAGRPGSLGYEKNDANTYASWGVDYLKYDNCYDNNIPPEKRYPIMRDALNATGRPILFSMCEWGVNDPATWAPSVGNSWRTTGDISDNWDSMISRIDYNDHWAGYAGPGAWNDPDMLEVGNGGMTTAEYRTHFSLWCISKSPLLIGCDITKMSQDTFNILTNTELIAVNQDSLGIQGRKILSTGNTGIDVWGVPVADGSTIAVIVNRSSQAATYTVDLRVFGIGSGPVLARDLWAHKDLGAISGTYTATIGVHDSVVLKLQSAHEFAVDA